jgi:two-component system, chemotaxis family, protein-glutamate methylesterase/glutaminase
VPFPDPPPVRIVGIGASAGGIDALLDVLAALPADLPHALLIVLHLPPHGHSVLAEILDRRTALHVVVARDGEVIRAGYAYVASPDLHLTVRGPAMALTRGPHENGVRPAVDPLFRSLAAGYGRTAVAVVLSGALGDGARGALAVARAGGYVLVQDPADALVSSMPLRAIAETAGAAEVRTAAEIGAALARMGPPPEIAIRPLAGARI